MISSLQNQNQIYSKYIENTHEFFKTLKFKNTKQHQNIFKKFFFSFISHSKLESLTKVSLICFDSASDNKELHCEHWLEITKSLCRREHLQIQLSIVLTIAIMHQSLFKFIHLQPTQVYKKNNGTLRSHLYKHLS